MLTSVPQKTGWKPCISEKISILKNLNTLWTIWPENGTHSLDRDTFHGDWEEFTKHFSRYFSTQGWNIKHLHERWRAFSFDPANDDIEEYIRDVKEAAKQLGHGWWCCGQPAQGHHADRNYMALFMAITTSHSFAPCLRTSMLRSHSLPLPHPPPPPHPRCYNPIHSFKDSPQDPS